MDARHALYRLTNETITASSGGSITYGYDAVGNRTHRTSTVSGVTNQTFAYTANDWLTSDGTDANGNITNSAGGTYRYDAENRLTNFNAGTATFIHDGDGLRRIKTADGVTTYYVWDTRSPNGFAQVVEELTAPNAVPVRLYTHGLDLICQRQGSGTSYYGYDGNGNVRFLTGTNAAITDTYIYDAFGLLLTSAGTTTNFYRYSGEQYDPNLGFTYLRARYLNSGTGRFLTRDTYAGSIYDPHSLHRYTYCHNDPVNHSDPSGQMELSSALIIVASIAIVGSFIAYKVYNSPRMKAARGMANSRPLTEEERQKLISGLRIINLNEKTKALLDYVDRPSHSGDGAFETGGLEIRVHNVKKGPGAHLTPSKQILFIPQHALEGNDDGVTAAIFTFGEFQHDGLGGGLNEQQAQAELDELLALLRKRYPGIKLPEYRHGE